MTGVEFSNIDPQGIATQNNMPNDFKFDVFLSHSAKDKPVMRVLANRLKEDKLRVWFGESDSLSPQGEGRG